MPTLKIDTLGTKTMIICLHGQSLVVGSGRNYEIPYKKVPSHIDFYNTGRNHYPEGYGIEQGLFPHLSTKYRWVVFKHAIGSTRIAEWIPGTLIYADMMQNLKTIIARYENPKVYGVYLGIGEGDSNNKSAHNYYANTLKFIEGYRAELNYCPHFILSKTATMQGCNIDIIRAAEIQLAKDVYRCKLLDLDHIEKREDGIHNTSQGTLDVGDLLGQYTLR